MPVVDLTLSQLSQYHGSNPKPADFDEFWAAGLAEMQAIGPAVTLVPAAFQTPTAECFDLFFTGVCGARIHAKYLRPKQVTPVKAPAVLMFHGYAGNSGDWYEKLPYSAAGFHVAALDCRGQAGLSKDIGGVKGNTLNGHIIRGLNDAPEKLLYRSIFLDAAQLAGIVMALSDVDETRVGAMGASQGGGLALACAALEPRIRCLASVYPFLCDYKRVWNMDLMHTAYAELKTFFRQFDPRHQRETEIFTRLGYIDVVNLVPRIRGDVVMMTGLADVTCPPSTQYAAYNAITSTKKHLLYPDFGHETLPDCQEIIYQFMLEHLM